MAKNKYLTTTPQPIQTLSFHLANKHRVRTILRSHPNSSGTQVAYVDVDGSIVGSAVLSRISSPGTNLTVFQAGVLAFQYAQSEAQRLKTHINGAELEGEEFLEMADVVQLTGKAFLVTVV